MILIPSLLQEASSLVSSSLACPKVPSNFSTSVSARSIILWVRWREFIALTASPRLWASSMIRVTFSESISSHWKMMSWTSGLKR